MVSTFVHARRREISSTPALSRLIARASKDIETLAVEIADSYPLHIEDYARLPYETRGLVIDSVRSHVNALLRDLEGGSDEGQPFDYGTFEKLGAERMRMGVSIGALMRAFNVLNQHVWAYFRQIADEESVEELQALSAVVDQILKHAERASTAYAAGFMRQAMTTWSDREVTRYALLDALVTGRIDLDEIASERSVDHLASAYIAIVAERRSSDGPPSRTLRTELATLSRYVNSLHESRALVGVRHESVYLLWPAESTHDVNRVSTVATGIVEALPDMAVGVGELHKELTGVRESFDEAVTAAQIARGMKVSSWVSYADVLLERIVMQHPGFEHLADNALAKIIAYDERKSAELMYTLDRYVWNKHDVSATAEELFVHPNTVLYRLNRIGEITGLDPRSGRGLLVLPLAILARQLSRAGELQSGTEDVQPT